jgi:hypothetical protein
VAGKKARGDADSDREDRSVLKLRQNSRIMTARGRRAEGGERRAGRERFRDERVGSAPPSSPAHDHVFLRAPLRENHYS